MLISKLRIILIICIISLPLGPFQNCAPPQANNSSAGSLGLSKSVEAFSQTLQPTLTSNCAGCHGGSQIPNFAVTDPTTAHNTIMSFGLVNLNSPGSSVFVNKIMGGHQGFSSGLATAMQTYIQNWANIMNNLPPTGGGGGGGSTVVYEAKYASIAQRILIPSCVSCHGAISAGGGVRLDNYTEVLKSVVANQPNASVLYTKSLSGLNHTTPIANLPAEAISAISNWISMGAQNN